MYYWSVIRLAEDLVEQRVPQDEQAGCLAGLIVVMWSAFMVLGSRESSDFAYFLGIIIIGGGVDLCRRNNKKGDNKDFIPRFFCLGWVVALRALVCAALPASGLAHIVADQWGYSIGMHLIPIVLCIYFWRLHHWIGVVSRGKVNRGIISPESESDSLLDKKGASH
jgi:hypothetical protein